jgi:hypothetical protein
MNDTVLGKTQNLELSLNESSWGHLLLESTKIVAQIS